MEVRAGGTAGLKFELIAAQRMNEKNPGQTSISIAKFGVNAGFVEELFSQLLSDPKSLSEDWQQFFFSLTHESKQGNNYGQRNMLEKVAETDGSQADTTHRSGNNKIAPAVNEGDEVIPLRGVAAKIVENMENSLTIPTATSQRVIPVKLMEENRRVINQYLHRIGGKLSFTHIISWAIIRALQEVPVLNAAFAFRDGAPHRIQRRSVNFGVAVDLEKRDGTRSLIVPNIKGADAMDFNQFVAAYNDLIGRAKTNAIAPQDFQATTISLTNPGTVGTTASLPRLMLGQGAIIATGAIDFPAEYHGMSPKALATLGVSKTMTVTCTYDHRIIQGAESGQFLGRVHQLLLGKHDFYEHIFADLRVPYKPAQWSQDKSPALVNRSNEKWEQVEKQARVLELINYYRVRGHLIADLDPLSDEAHYHPELDPANFDLTVWDLDREFITGGLGGISHATLREILDILKQTYCEQIGVEFRHIQYPEEKIWLQSQMEPTRNRAPLTDNTKRHVLLDLIAAEAFEKFMHTRYVGHKRFSLEGAEVVIPILGHLLTSAAKEGVQEAVIGMAHRGRLNVLANIIRKPYTRIFSEFQGDIDPQTVYGSGDVKYHLGASGIYETTKGDKITVTVPPNPSHLEAVNPVVEGIVRAKQDRAGDSERQYFIPVLIHGDAAFAGQGVVAETLNLSQLKGYRTGGTIHIIINNQIGFTTTPEEARSTPYATDVAKMVQAPIFHINGDDPEAAIRATIIAFEYRQKYKKDVVIDVVCYRRHGHNEGDEPSYTQPLLYKKIEEHPSVRFIYQQKLLREGTVRAEELAEKINGARKCLEDSYEEAQRKKFRFEPDVPLAVSEEEVQKVQPAGKTRVEMQRLEKVMAALTTFPESLKVHPKLEPQFKKRQKLFFDDKKIDWALAEALAFGTLLLDGTPVRLCGQDSCRGTFSQRHLVLIDLNTGDEYVQLNHITLEQATMQAFDSLLSEEAVVGFEFGYTVADPLTLVIWEAQFGDFANGAQVLIDNFIASSEAKWRQPCDLVMLLPHGSEGQGPEHSSARLERFLQLCAENNLQVCNCSTPAQYFHLLRRQMRDAVRKPLIVMTPKSLLRHPLVISSPEELSQGRFREVIDDPGIKDKTTARRVLLCSGKLYYDLYQFRAKESIDDVALIRLEQFYPFPTGALAEALQSYSKTQQIFWVQEEPKNMGAWYFIKTRLWDELPQGLTVQYRGRPESASPATGRLKTHKEEQARLIREAFLE